MPYKQKTFKSWLALVLKYGTGILVSISEQTSRTYARAIIVPITK